MNFIYLRRASLRREIETSWRCFTLRRLFKCLPLFVYANVCVCRPKMEGEGKWAFREAVTNVSFHSLIKLCMEFCCWLKLKPHCNIATCGKVRVHIMYSPIFISYTYICLVFYTKNKKFYCSTEIRNPRKSVDQS